MAQKKRDEEEIAAVRQELPLEPPADVLEKVKARMKEGRLVYRVAYVTDPLTSLKTKAVSDKCTECGEKVYYPYAISCHSAAPFGFLDAEDGNDVKVTGSACVCTQCGAKAQAMHVGSFQRYGVIDKKYFMTIHNIRGHFVALSWVVFKEFNKDAEISYEVDRYEGVAIIGGRPIRYTGYDIFCTYGFSWGKEWQSRAVWRDNCDEWEEDEIFFDRDVIESSDAAKSAVDVFIRDIKTSVRVCAYLQLWARDPSVENLVRSGLSPFVRNVINAATEEGGYYYATHRTFSVKRAETYFDRKKVKPHEMIGLEKHEIGYANVWPLDQIDLYKKTYREQGARLTPEQLTVAGKVGFDTLERIGKAAEQYGYHPSTVRILNYLRRQGAMKAKTCVSRVGFNLLDYWVMVRQVQGTVPPELLFPKDLKREHDRMIRAKEDKVSKEQDEKIREIAEKLEWLSWQDEETGLCIRPARGQQELIDEGRALSHCVGSYAGRVAAGQTAILFIRKIADPETHYFTLEYNHDHVVQNRGKKNRDRTEEVVIFETKWLKHLEQIKEERENGKRNNQTSRQRAGA